MSLLAKILVIFNLVLALAFFGSSATLFFNRSEWRSEFQSHKSKSNKDIEDFQEKLKGPRAKMEALATEIAQLRTKNNELATDNQQVQKQVTDVKGQLNEAQRQQRQLAETSEASAKLSERLQGTNDNLESRIQGLSGDLDKAKTERAQAVSDLTRMALSYNQLKALYSELQIAKREADDKLEEAEIILAALERKGVPFDSVTRQPPVNGQVQAVDQNSELVVLSVGRDQGVREGSEFTVSRGGNFIGKVKVIQLYDDFSGARMIYAKDDNSIEVGDRIMTPAY